MKSKEIIKLCENFYDIINFEPIEGDSFTPKLINLYRSYIFIDTKLTDEKIEYIQNYDKAMKKYIDDYLFRKDVQKCITSIKVTKDTKDIIRLIVDKIVDFFCNYSVYTTRVIYISKWI